MPGPIRVLELRSVRGTGGGPEKTILLGATRMDSRRCAVTVCYIRDLRDDIFGIDAWATQLGLDYVEVRERHSFDPAIWPSLRRLVRTRQFDIIHAHDYKTNLIALMLAWAEGVIPLSTVHGWTGHSRRERFLYYPLDKRLLARFPRLVAVSSQIRTELVGAGAPPERVTTVLNAIDHQEFQRDRRREADARVALGLAPNEIVIGAVGRLEPQKRFDVLLDVFARLRTSRPELRLFIAGDGGSRGALEATATRLGVNGACRFLGHRSDIVWIHHALDLFVQSSGYEGTPNAVLEAMALETAVVATDVGGTAELLQDGVHGLLVPAGDAGALARAIEQALTEQHTTSQRVVAARRRVERELSFDARVKAIHSIYEELVAMRPRRRCQGQVGWA